MTLFSILVCFMCLSRRINKNVICWIYKKMSLTSSGVSMHYIACQSIFRLPFSQQFMYHYYWKWHDFNILCVDFVKELHDCVEYILNIQLIFRTDGFGGQVKSSPCNTITGSTNVVKLMMFMLYWDSNWRISHDKLLVTILFHFSNAVLWYLAQLHCHETFFFSMSYFIT